MKSMIWLKPIAGFVSIVALASCGGSDDNGGGGGGNSAPVASDVIISGYEGAQAEIGDVLSVEYTFTDADGDSEGGTTVTWYVDGAAVEGQVGSTFRVNRSNAGSSIYASVLPRAASGTAEGTEVSSSTVSVAAIPVNAAPTAAVAVNSFANVVVGETITLDGSSSSDSDGFLVAHTWVVTGETTGPGATYSGEIVEISFDAEDDYTVTLTVRDDGNKESSTTVTVTNVIANELPVADAGPDFSIEANGTAEFNGTGSTDSDGTIESYQWVYGEIVLTGARPSTVLSTEGFYDFTLTVTDNDGSTATDVVVVEVTPANTPPTANAGADISINAGETANFDGTASSDLEGDITSFSWASTGLATTLTGAQPSAPFNTPGSFTVTLTVVDEGGLDDQDTVTVDVNALPVAVIDPSSPSILLGETVNFNAAGSSDSDGTISSYVWSSTAFDSDLSGSAQDVTFDEAGSFTVTLTVTDDDGATAQAMTTVVVTEINNAPVASVGEVKTITVAIDEVINLDGTASTDLENNIVSYTWSSEDLAEDLTGAETTTSFSEAGEYVITLTVEDALGEQDTDTLTVTVQPDVVAANAGADFDAETTVAVNFDGSGTEFGNDVMGTPEYVWTSECFEEDLTGVAPEFTFDSAGTCEVTLTVTVDEVSDSDVVVVTVTEYNDAPVADAGRSVNVTVNTLVTFDGSGSTDVQDGTPASYSWASDAFDADLTGVDPTFTFDTVGSYEVTLTVEDSVGETDTDVITVTVLEVGMPLADAGADQTIEVGQSLSFDGSGSSDDSAIVSYEWTNTYWAEAVTGEVTEAQTFNAVGTYEITLTITDDNDPANTGTDVVVVNVVQPADPMDLDGDVNAVSTRYPGVTKEGDEWVVIFHAPEVAAPFFGADTSEVASVRIFGDFTKETADSTDYESLQNGVELIPTVDGNYYWLRAVDEAFAQAPQHGDNYRFALLDAEGNNIVTVQDPAARWVTSSNVNRMEFELFEGEEYIEAGMSRIYLSDNYVWETPNGAGENEWTRPAWGYYNIYQLHPSRFTDRNGDVDAFAQVAAELDNSGENDYINDLGVTAIQLMPVYEFPGDESWGYNPSFFYAIESAYGGPDALKALVDEAHGQGIAVVLDIVVNHMGTGDNILFQIDPYQYDSMSDTVTDASVYIDGDTVWGGLPNFDNDIAKHYFLNHVKYLAEEFNIDAFRFDSTHTVYKNSGETDTIRIDGSGGGYEFLQELYTELKGVDGAILMMAEEFPNDFNLTAEDDGFGNHGPMDSLWSQATHYELVEALEGSKTWNQSIDDNGLFSALGDNWQDNTNYIESHDSAGAFTETDEDGLVCLSDEGKRFATSFDAAVANQYTKIAMAANSFAQGIPMNFMGFEAAETTGFYSDLACYGMSYMTDDETPIEVLIDDEPTLPLTAYEDAGDTYTQALLAWYKAVNDIRRADQVDNNGEGLVWSDTQVIYLWNDNKVVAFSRNDGEYIVVIHNAGGSDDDGYETYGILDQGDRTAGVTLTGNYTEILNSSWVEYQASDLESTDAMGTGEVTRRGTADAVFPLSDGVPLPPYGIIVLQRQ